MTNRIQLNKNILKRNTFWMTLILIFILIDTQFPQKYVGRLLYNLTPFNSSFPLGTWNLNRTIGWGIGMDVSLVYIQMSKLITFYTLPSFAIGYAALFLAKRKTKSILLVLHLIVIGITQFIALHWIALPSMLLFFSWGLFFLSIFFSRKVKTI